MHPTGPAVGKRSRIASVMHRGAAAAWIKWADLSRRPVHAAARTFWGERMTVELPEPISVAIFRDGYIEGDVTDALLRHLHDGAVFFDVGAHVGYFTLLASRLVGTRGTVVAFEPTPGSRALLEVNVAQRDNVVIEPRACWSENTTLTFNDFGPRFSALNSVFRRPRSRPDEPVPPPRTYEVDAVTLDDFTARTGLEPGFVKIDAESAEYEVLRGMDRILQGIRPVVTVEVGDVDIPGAPDVRVTLGYLVERGYQPVELVRGEWVARDIRDHYDHGNVVLVPAA